MQVSTRKALETDLEFIFSAKEGGCRPHIEAVHGKWDEAWQRMEHRHDMDSGSLEVITCHGQDAGYIYVLRHGDMLNLCDICLLPEYQGKGIGTSLIKALQAEARAGNMPLELGSFKINLSAIKLYTSLGFVKTSESPTHIRMRYL